METTKNKNSFFEENVFEIEGQKVFFEFERKDEITYYDILIVSAHEFACKFECLYVPNSNVVIITYLKVDFNSNYFAKFKSALKVDKERELYVLIMKIIDHLVESKPSIFLTNGVVQEDFVFDIVRF